MRVLYLVTLIVLSEVKSSHLNSLQMVQILFGHGDRNPICKYPNDPYIEESIFAPANEGQLTNEGRRQLYELGRFLRRRYDGFLGRVYAPSDIHIYASDMDRSIMSAEMNLAALYEPTNLTENWNETLDWTPVPVRTIPRELDMTLEMNKPCPKYQEIFAKILHSNHVRSIVQQHQELLDYLSHHTGIKNFGLGQVPEIRDILRIEKSHNYTLPKWTNDLMDKLDYLTGLSLTLKTMTNEAKRLAGGPLLQQFLASMQGFVRNSFDKKRCLMYSGHDTTLARLMGTLSMFDPIPPPPASALLLELHRDRNMKFYVEIFFRNETSREPYSLNVPNCGDPCYLHTLLKITKHLIPENWEVECMDETTRLRAASFIPRVFIGLCTLMISIVVLSFVIVNQKRPKVIRRFKRRPYEYELI